MIIQGRCISPCKTLFNGDGQKRWTGVTPVQDGVWVICVRN